MKRVQISTTSTQTIHDDIQENDEVKLSKVVQEVEEGDKFIPSNFDSDDDSDSDSSDDDE